MKERLNKIQKKATYVIWFMSDRDLETPLNHPDDDEAINDHLGGDIEHNLDALVPGQTTESFREKFHRKFGRIPKTVGACILMLILGIILLILPSLTDTFNNSGKIGMYVLGSLLLIPSVYVAYILYHVFNDTPGFDIDGLPLWDE